MAPALDIRPSTSKNRAPPRNDSCPALGSLPTDAIAHMRSDRGLARRPHRMWSQVEIEKLQLLDQNTRDMLGQASKDFHLPTLESDPLPPARKSLAGSKILSPDLLDDMSALRAINKGKRSTAMLDVAGYSNNDFDDLGEELPLDETIARLKDIQLSSMDPRLMLAISGIVGELQAGVCQVRFHEDGSFERFVTLHALRVWRPVDNHVLIQVGRWRPRHSFMPFCVYPGSKRPSAKDFVTFIDFLMRELKPLLGGHFLEKSGSSSEVFRDNSRQFGEIPTTYRRMLQHVKLKPRTPGRKSLKLDPSVREVPPSGGLCMVRNIPLTSNAMIILRSSSEAEVYAWIPAALADQMEGSADSKDVKSALKQWAMRFDDEVTSFCVSATTAAEEPNAGPLPVPTRKRTMTGGSFSR
ncbi:unnamed protein product [Symbiodinium sp. CCMP2592]|nr:unnamed protein product [Symbiodinium sp. CCMP2592]